MNTLVIIEHEGQTLSMSSRVVIEAAKKFNQPIHALLVGHKIDAVANTCAEIAGIDTVLITEHENYSYVSAESYTNIILSIAKSYDVIMAPATTFGKNILPRVAAKLDVGQVSDVTEILSNDTFIHPIYAGNALETVKVNDAVKVLTVRTTAFDPCKQTQNACEIVKLSESNSYSKTKFIKEEKAKLTRPELSQANIVVSGGRGLQSKEQFVLIEALADALGAAIGASRAAVDAGFVPNDYQVGQTGKIVAPALYIAVGISGAIQHLAGMKDSKVIVAINKDEEAPIFQLATYGLVGDLFTLVPELIQALKSQ